MIPCSRSAEPVQVLLTSTSYPTTETDWRGLFILRLVEALAARDDLDLRVWAPRGPLPANARSALSTADAEWLDRLLAAGGIAHQLRRNPLRGLASAAVLVGRLHGGMNRVRPQMLHLNWLQSAAAVPSRLAAPQLVTALGSDMRLLKVPGMRTMLRRAFRRRPTLICPNAAWMAAPLAKAFADVAAVEHVPFGIDPRWYAIERKPATSPSIWLAVTRITRAKLGELFAWGQPLFKGGSRELHLFGPMQESVTLPEWVHYHGPTTPADLASRWFPMARALVSLSVHDEGLPQVMLEAMASGLPIIASGIPAHVELLSPAHADQLCRNPAEFACAVERLECNETNRAAGARARDWASRTVGTWDDCAGRYVERYRRLLAENA